MNMKNELPKRKDIRLKNFDYSSPGVYFITICTENRKNYFWNGDLDPHTFEWHAVGTNCVRPQNLPLSEIGNAVLVELEKWHKTYDAVSLCSYVIMPNHLHIMVFISSDVCGGGCGRPQVSPTGVCGDGCGDVCGRPQVSPTIDRMVKQFKGAVTKKIGRSVWQKSFMEHVIRNKQDFEIRSKYIYENPIRWYYDELYTEEQDGRILP